MSTLNQDATGESADDQQAADRRHHADAASSGPDPITRRHQRMQHELHLHGIERRTPLIKLDYLLAAVVVLVFLLLLHNQ